MCFVILSCGGTSQSKPKDLQDQPKTQSVDQEPVYKYPELLNIDFLTGYFDPESRPDFSAINITYADREGLFMHKEAYDAFIKMYEEAVKEGINFQIRSAARNFNYQRRIWEAKWSGQKILTGGINAKTQIKDPILRAKEIMKYSSMPGTSRHHWGTDIDLNAFENSYFESGEGLKLFNWLEANAARFGFVRPYTAKGESRPHGYEEEKWHWSYHPISKELTHFAASRFKNKELIGFSGAETAEEVKVKEHYILGISKDCF